jgi:hypothetical protein
VAKARKGSSASAPSLAVITVVDGTYEPELVNMQLEVEIEKERVCVMKKSRSQCFSPSKSVRNSILKAM